jgi:serpin B
VRAATHNTQPVICAVAIVAILTVGLASQRSRPVAPGARAPGGSPRDVVDGTTSFAFDLYKHLRARDGNLACSPFSISIALATTYAGARGQTAREIAATLHLTDTRDSVHSAFAKLLDALHTETAGASARELRIANALWVQRTYALLPTFVEVARTSYRSVSRELDFRAAEDARRTINAWADRESGGKLMDLVPPSLLDARTRLLITNITYFKVPWLTQFRVADTRDARFSVASSRDVQVHMMRQTGPFKFLENEVLQALEIPYAGADMAMLLLLPRMKNRLGELEASLTEPQLAGWLKGLREQPVEVSIPRVRVASGFELRPALARLGMRRAFEPGEADFTGIGGASGALYLADVLHQTRVELNEEGTVAAAGSAVVAKSLSAGLTASFSADHPFLFLIRHTRTGAVLVLGRVVDPTVTQ